MEEAIRKHIAYQLHKLSLKMQHCASLLSKDKLKEANKLKKVADQIDGWVKEMMEGVE